MASNSELGFGILRTACGPLRASGPRDGISG